MKRFAIAAAAAVSLSVSLGAQAPVPSGQPQQPPAPLPGVVAEVKTIYTNVHNYITKAVEQFPADKLTWQPTPAVRSWARLIGHITDDNNGACFLLAGETQRPGRVDTADTAESAANKLSKDDLLKGYKESVERCQKAFAAVTEANMAERNGPTGGRSKIGTLIYNTSHTNEHYGNIVTYMRLNNMVPPSTTPRGQ
jgi:uncharacterized damage-inducible protein DinB